MDGAYYFVYITVNKITEEKYLGQHCTKNPKDDYLGSGPYLIKAIKEYGKHNFERYYIDECLNIYDLAKREKYWITKFDAVNRDDWYNDSNKCAPNVYFEYGDIDGKISKANTGKIRTEDHKKNMRHPHKHMSEEGKRNIANANRKKPHYKTEEFRAKMQLAHKNKPHSEESKKLMSERLKGKPAWNKGLTSNIDERVKKYGLSHKGHKHSEETKRKISETKRKKY